VKIKMMNQNQVNGWILTDGEEGVEMQSEWVDERQEVEANEQQRVLINQE